MPPMKPANINLPPSTPQLEQAQAFAKDYPVEHLFTSLDELAQSPDVDAVYIASPNSLHFPQTRLFLSHRSVICEKPLASNLQEVEAAIALAKENNVVLFEAFKPPVCLTFSY